MCAHFFPKNIISKNYNTCQVDLFDKRREFKFKEKSLANWNSNLSERIFRNIIVSQMSRINYICSNSEEFDKTSIP